MTQFKVDFNDFKRRDNTNLMEITLYNDSGEQITPNRDHQWSGKALKFGDGDKRVDQELAVTLDGDKIGVPSKQLENLPSGDYGLELWEVNSDSKTIYPSAGFVEFRIHRNADEALESVTPTTDINKVINDLHQAGLNMVIDGIEMLAPDATPSITSEFRDGKNHIKLHVPIGSVDNTALTNAPAFKALQTEVATLAGVNRVPNTSSTATVFNSSTIMPGTNRVVQIGTWSPGNIKANTTYTMHVTLNFDNVTGSSPNFRYQVYDGASYNSPDFFETSQQSIPTGTTQSVTYAYTFNMTTPAPKDYGLSIRFDNITGGTVSYQELMIEEGTVAHPWSANPTDNATVKSVATLQTQVNNSAVGTNLLTGTSGSLQTKQITNLYNAGPQATNGNYKIKLVKGQTYTYRAWLDNTNGQVPAFVNVRFTPIGGTDYNLGSGTSIVPGSTGYSTLLITAPADGYAWFSPFAYVSPQTALAKWKEEKLEKGSVATDWSANPTEILTQSDYAKIQAAIVALGGSLK